MPADHDDGQTPTAKRAGVPVIGLLLLSMAIPMLAAGIAVSSGAGRQWHPLLDAPGAGLALVVSALALIGSAAFPIVLARLAAREPPPDDPSRRQ
ncbi:MAG: hypothetical protein KDH15_01805 [Rhodocyclaceae bacterium]|nr:hypothetical protein [Rhodocyclaceae bacterium]